MLCINNNNIVNFVDGSIEYDDNLHPSFYSKLGGSNRLPDLISLNYSDYVLNSTSIEVGEFWARHAIHRSDVFSNECIDEIKTDVFNGAIKFNGVAIPAPLRGNYVKEYSTLCSIAGGSNGKYYQITRKGAADNRNEGWIYLRSCTQSNYRKETPQGSVYRTITSPSSPINNKEFRRHFRIALIGAGGQGGSGWTDGFTWRNGQGGGGGASMMLQFYIHHFPTDGKEHVIAYIHVAKYYSSHSSKNKDGKRGEDSDCFVVDGKFYSAKGGFGGNRAYNSASGNDGKGGSVFIGDEGDAINIDDCWYSNNDYWNTFISDTEYAKVWLIAAKGGSAGKGPTNSKTDSVSMSFRDRALITAPSVSIHSDGAQGWDGSGDNAFNPGGCSAFGNGKAYSGNGVWNGDPVDWPSGNYGGGGCGGRVNYVFPWTLSMSFKGTSNYSGGLIIYN